MCEAEILGVFQNCFNGEILGLLETPPRCFRVTRLCLSRKQTTMFGVYQCSGETVVLEYCMGNSSAMDDRMRLKLLGYDVEVLGYATVQAARDSDVG
ncbi:UNVERIFIED_CONTAM: hypothetical protein Slati_0091500 [Sesamum latifolium]|uniref:Uncharacterized protein n=1 Tax=Sesamum latifolium TaxID=2727402 RepID=A0AAW2Y8D6_9LAMI